MLSTVNKMFLGSLIDKQGLGKLINVFRHKIKYPRSPFVLGGGINIIHRCNLSCSFCVYGLNRNINLMDDMDEETFDRCLNLPVFKYAFYLNLGSGEPFLHKHLFTYIEKVQKKNKIVNLFTNGTLIIKRLDELLKTPPNILSISLYNGYENIQIRSLEKLVGKKPPKILLAVSKLIGKNNLDDMKQILDLVGPIGVQNIWFQQFLIKPGDEKAKKNLIFDTDIDIIQYISNVVNYQKKKYPLIDCYYPHPIPTNPKKRGCLSLYKGFSIEPNGAIQPCCAIHPMGKNTYGNLFQDELDYINDHAYMSLKTTLPDTKKELPIMCKNCFMLNLS